LFFDARAPVTGAGKVALARALFAAGEIAAAEFHLRDAWINDNFTVAEERAILSEFGKSLRPQDHAARADLLLWSLQVTNARRVFFHLDRQDRTRAEARAALLMRAANAPQLFSSLSVDEQRDSGVLLAAIRYFRRTGDEAYAIALSRLAPDNPEDLREPERWWDERQLLMRWALREARFADAYELAAHHGLAEGDAFSEAEFNAGWIALRFLNRPDRAETHFLALASAVSTPISLSRAYYWAGRAAQAREDAALASQYFSAAAQYYYSYYGQLAAEQLGGAAAAQQFGPPAQSSAADRALFSARPTVAALRMLADLNLDYEFMVFAYHIDDQLERPGEYVELARLAYGEGAPHLAVRAGKVAIGRNAFDADVAYPLVFVPEEAQRFVSPEIILGLSRQESEFNPRAYSHAGARGVMQLLPSTALITARKEGLPYSQAALLDDPIYNMTLGSAHLSHLLERFEGSLIMTLAGYNAGPARVDQWVSDFGDPRREGVDPVDWIELVPFAETRNYIQRVLENIQVYRGRLTDGPIPGRLTQDLERGGASSRVAQTPHGSDHLVKLASLKGAQSLAPLPERTAARANSFKLAMNTPSVPQTLEAEDGGAGAGPAAVTDGISPGDVGATTKEPPNEPPNEPQSQDLSTANPAPTDETTPQTAPAPAPSRDAAPEDPAAPEVSQNSAVKDNGGKGVVEPAPMAFEGDIVPMAIFAKNNDVTHKSARSENEQAPAAADPSAEGTSFAAPSPVNAPQGAAEIPALVDSGQSGAGEPPDERAAPPFQESLFAEKDDRDDVEPGGECESYLHFLTRNAEKETSAADLNAAALAEFDSGGPVCD
jgi:soluble lytic murein transglycosylase